MGEGDTLINALVGAVATVLLSFTGVSPVLGGALAGYLQRGTRRDGIRVGAIAGAIAAIPFVLFGFVFVGLFAAGPVFAGGPGDAGAFGLFGLFGLAVLLGVILVTVGLSAVGGLVGVYVATETDVGS